jgi:hypothetical protein
MHFPFVIRVVGLLLENGRNKRILPEINSIPLVLDVPQQQVKLQPLRQGCQCGQQGGNR